MSARHIAGSALALPVKPVRFARGDQLALGTYSIVFLAGGGYTVRRDTALGRWYPITASDAAWRRWPSYEACRSEVMEGDAFAFADWPHWGSTTP